MQLTAWTRAHLDNPAVIQPIKTYFVDADGSLPFSYPHPNGVPPGKKHVTGLNRKLGGLQSWSARLGDETNLMSLPGFETRTAQPVA